MAEQDWLGINGSSRAVYEPAVAEPYAFTPPPPPPMPSARSSYELRPLTTGEILDRTFYLYRSNFWLFVALAAIAASVNTVAGLAQVLYIHFAGVGALATAGGKMNPAAMFQTMGVLAISMISSVLYLAVYSVTQAATTSAVTAIYLGDTTSMKKALNEVKGRWFRFVLIGLWQLWSAMWAATVAVIVVTALMGYFVARSPGNIGLAATLGFLIFAIVIAGSIYGVIAYIRNSFAVPAAVMEGLKVRKAMRRSKQLAAGTKGRVFLLLLLVMMLYFVAIAIAAPIGLIVQQNKTTHILLWQSINLAIGFFTGSVVGPVGAIGLCLFYIDQRIRKEGFDIEFLIERSGPVPEMPVAVVAAPPVAVEPEAPAEASVTEQS